MPRKTTYLYLGITLFALYLTQDILNLKWLYLQQLQGNETYRRWSGLTVFLFVTYQWLLTFIRMRSENPVLIDKIYHLHTWIGACAPIFFYFHSTSPGYAYLLILTLSFYSNFILGMVNLDIIKNKAAWYFKAWMISHVTLSILISMLSVYHIWIVFYYN